MGRIYCMSKAYINLVAMMLVDDGLLDLHGPVSRYVPSMQGMQIVVEAGGNPQPAQKEITVWHLLTHSSGLSYGVDFNFPPNPVQERYVNIVEGVESGRLDSLASFVAE